ncbi:clumping factor A-like isoform X2 [Galleria mellonella]|uniref:Clumping factor A-like isoform X2 n=1 Tax=Galleria mellonella TaxID=7137 RepID=A0ABM3M8J2_GALME|nr:clumping factor A-like isoform X2 [Galleria mellonella]
MNKFIYLIFALLCIVKLTKSDEEGEERIAKEQTDEFSKTSSNVAASLDSITDVLSDSEFLAKSDNDRDASRTERSAVNDDNVKKATEKFADEELKTSGAVDDLYNKESKNDNEMESKNDNERSGDDSSVSKLDDNSESRNAVKMDENPDNESKADDSLDNVQKSDEPIDVLNKSDKQEESSLDNNDSPILREGISAPENLVREFTSEDTIQLDKPDTSLLNFEGTRRMLNPVVDEAAKSAVKTAVNVEQYVKSVAEPDYISRTISNVNDFVAATMQVK